jgi:DNA-binding MarR family transcriptional regulator
MDLDAYRQLQLLTEISSDDSVTQRRLAKRYRLALGLTNFLIRRLVKKGYVKIVNLQRKRLQYLITPKGLAEKARLTYEYLEYSLALYRHLRTFLTQTLSVILESKRTRTVLYGTGELAEIALLASQERGLQVVAVVTDEDADGTMTFMGRPVRPVAALSSLAFDWIVLATFKDHRRIIQQLCRAGVPKEKILIISGHEASALSRASFGSVPVEPSVLPEVLAR